MSENREGLQPVRNNKERRYSQTYETQSGYTIEVINIGGEDQKVDINIDSIDKVLSAQDKEGALKDTPIRLYFDNRNIGEAIMDVIRGKSREKVDLTRISDLFIRITAPAGAALPNERAIYINTQELLFLDIIGLRSLEDNIKHELRHLNHSEEWRSQHTSSDWKATIKEIVPIPMSVIGNLLWSLNLPNIVTSATLGTAQIEQLAGKFGVVVLGFAMVGKAYSLTKNNPAEVDARASEQEHKALVIYKTRPEHFTKRMFRKFFQKN